MIIQNKKSKFLLFLFLGVNVFGLFYYKYLNLYIDILNNFIGTSFSNYDIASAMGISYYTFQSISYIVDIYKNRINCEKNFIKFIVYITFFPKLFLGPIVRYKDFRNEITLNIDNFTQALELFIIGLAKKVILGDFLGKLSSSIYQAAPIPILDNVSGISAWFAVLLFTLQIYYDFSGYSDMAKAIAQMMGYYLPQNFDYPYNSTSISEFWRKWHISLSSWFRDYLFIEIGGSKKGNVYLNLMTVFIVSGIWHGATIGFLIWGIWHGTWILIEKLIKSNTFTNKFLMKIPKKIKKLFTFLIVSSGWIPFFTEKLSSLIKFLKILFGITKNTNLQFEISYYLNNKNLFFILLAIIFIFPSVKNFIEKNKKNQRFLFGYYTALIILFVFSISTILSNGLQPSLYFRF